MTKLDSMKLHHSNLMVQYEQNVEKIMDKRRKDFKLAKIFEDLSEKEILGSYDPRELKRLKNWKGCIARA